jgi:hypothetical protein
MAGPSDFGSSFLSAQGENQATVFSFGFVAFEGAAGMHSTATAMDMSGLVGLPSTLSIERVLWR